MPLSDRDSLLKLLKRFLATTINPAETNTGNLKDKEAFDNIKQIVSLALIADSGSIYNILKIVAEDYKSTVVGQIAHIDKILSVDGLFGIGANSKSSVDVTKLRKAARQIKSLNNGSIQSMGLAASATLQSFLRQEMMTLSLEGNTKRSTIVIEDFEKSISNAWQGIVDKKTSMSSVVSNFSKETLIDKALEKAVSAMASDVTLAADLLATSSESDLANISKAVELLTAGTSAFLDFLYSANEPLGTTIVSPKLGYTPFTALQFTGLGFLEPAQYVAKGHAHRAFLDYIIGSSSGYMVSLPNVDKRAHILCADAPYNLSAVVDPTANSGTINFLIDGTQTIPLVITTAEILSTSNFANPYAATKHEMNIFVSSKLSPYTFYINNDLSGDKLRFSTFSISKTDSTIEILDTSYPPFLEALGLTARTASKGKSLSKKFRDTNISTSSASWNDSPPLLRADNNESYFLFSNKGSIQEVTAVTENDLFIEISPGIEESTTNITYALSVEKPGTYIQPSDSSNTQVVVRRPPTQPNVLGEEIQGGFIRHMGKTGKIQTTVVSLPNFDESTSVRKGFIWNGFGTHGYWKPVIKSRGVFVHTRVNGSTGLPGPNKAAGTSGGQPVAARPSLNRFGNSNHSNNYYGTGTLGQEGSVEIKNCLFDFNNYNPNSASNTEMRQLYVRESYPDGSSLVNGLAFAPQIFDIKVGDYFKIVSADVGADGLDTITNTANFNGGVFPSPMLSPSGQRIREIRNWYPSHIFSSLEFLPPVEVPLSHTGRASLLDSDLDFKNNLNKEIDGINIKIVYAHRFTDTNAHFTSDGVAPGDIIILHETSLGVPNFINGSRYIPNDSSNSSLATGSSTNDKKQKFDTSWVKAFEVAYVQDKNTIYLNTGWVEGNSDLTSNGNLYDTPFTVSGTYRNIPQPAFTTDTSFPYESTSFTYNCWYQILRRGNTNYNENSVFSDYTTVTGDSDTDNLFAYMDSDYYSFFELAPSAFRQSTKKYFLESGVNPDFVQAGVQKGDILNIFSVSGTIEYGDGELSSYKTQRTSQTEGLYKVFSAQQDTLKVYKVTKASAAETYTTDYRQIPSSTGTYRKPQGFDFYVDNLSFTVYQHDYYKVFFCNEALFINRGVQAGMTLTITSGLFVGDYQIESVESNTTLKIVSDGTSSSPGFTHANGAGQSDAIVNFMIKVAQNTVYDPNATFQSDGIVENDIFVFRNNSGTISEHLVSSVTDQNTIVLKSNLPEADFITDRYYLIKKKADADGVERTTQFAFNSSNFTTGGTSGGFDDLPSLNNMVLRPINLATPSDAENYEQPVFDILLRTEDPTGSLDFEESSILSKGGLGWYADGKNESTTNTHLVVMEKSTLSTTVPMQGMSVSPVVYVYDSQGLYVNPSSSSSAILDWVMLMGKESPFFEDETNTFVSSMKQSRLTLNPGVREYYRLSPYDANTGKEFLAEVEEYIDSNVLMLNKPYPVEAEDGRSMSSYFVEPQEGGLGSDDISGDIVLWLKPSGLSTSTVTTTESTVNSGDAALFLPVRNNLNIGYGTTDITSWTSQNTATSTNFTPISCAFSVRFPRTGTNDYAGAGNQGVVFSLVNTSIYTAGQSGTIATVLIGPNQLIFKFRRKNNPAMTGIGPIKDIVWSFSTLINDDAWHDISFQWNGDARIQASDVSTAFTVSVEGAGTLTPTANLTNSGSGTLASFNGCTIFANDLNDTAALHIGPAYFSNLVIHANDSTPAPSYYPRQLGDRASGNSRLYFPLKVIANENRFVTQDVIVRDRAGSADLTNTDLITEMRANPQDGASRTQGTGTQYYLATGNQYFFNSITDRYDQASPLYIPDGGSNGSLFVGSYNGTNYPRFYLESGSNKYITQGNPISFVFYLKRTGIAGTFYLINAEDSGSNSVFWVTVNGATLTINTNNSAGTNTLQFNNALLANTWSQIVITWDGNASNLDTGATLHVNGTQETPNSTTISNTTVAAFNAVDTFLFFARDKIGTNQLRSYWIYKVYVYNSIVGDINTKYNSGVFNAAQYSSADHIYDFVDDSNTFNIGTVNGASILNYRTASSKVYQLNGFFGASFENSSRTGTNASNNWNNSSLASEADTVITTTITTTNVTGWADSSDYGNSASQAADSTAPLYQAASLNGYNTASFDGVNDFMTIPDSNSLDLDPANGVTFFAVIKFTGYQTNGILAKLLTKGDSSPQYQFGLMNNANPVDGTVSGMSFVSTDGSGDSDNNSITVDSWVLVAGYSAADSATGKWAINGTESTTNITADVGSANSSALTLGALSDGSEGIEGEVAEIILINATLGQADRQEIEGYLAHKYGLQTSLPSTHPNYSSAPIFQGELFGGKDKITYLWLPKDYPQPGMELLSSGRRDIIEDIVFVNNSAYTPPAISSETAPTISMENYSPALKLAKAIPVTSIDEGTFYIVNKGGDPFVSTFTASTIQDGFGKTLQKGFFEVSANKMIGKKVKFQTGEEAQIRAVPTMTTLEVDSLPTFLSANSYYSITVDEAAKIFKFYTFENISETVLEDDYLSIWTVYNPIKIQSFNSGSGVGANASYFNLKAPGVISGLSNKYFTVSRGGDPNYGHFVLLRFFMERIALPDTFLRTTLLLSEAVNQAGTDYTSVISAAAGSDTGTASMATTFSNQESSSIFFNIQDAINADSSQVNLSTAGVGDRVKIIYYNSEIQKHFTVYSYIRSVDTNTSCTLMKEIKITSSNLLIVNWLIETGSTPRAIKSLLSLRSKFSEIVSVIDEYRPQTSGAISTAIAMLEEQGMDRAIDVLKTGNLVNFFNLTFDEVSYSSKLMKDTKDFGGKL